MCHLGHPIPSGLQLKPEYLMHLNLFIDFDLIYDESESIEP
jgi:hypothetical protein